jgi:CelD/BcsL family acetyltransferase involved in cellulose biosynthesis
MPVLEHDWRELEHRSDASFFLSWHWMGTWLDCLPADVATRLLRVTLEGRPAGMAILASRSLVRRGWLRSRGLFLNSAGDPALDEITIEHNGFLAQRGAERDVARSAVTYLLERHPDWDELFLDGIRRPELLEGLGVADAQLRTSSQRTCYCVDLNSIRAAQRDYVDALGSSTRYNVRRSFREFEKQGPLRIEQAGDEAQAREYLSQLRELHQRYWIAKGQPGSFANAFFARFHDSLCGRAFSEGAIQLLRVTAGDTPLGYLYNFVYRGRVYNYQSGFAYAGGGLHDRPGIVCHALAIQHNLRLGHGIYDFMAGDCDYKRRLSTASESLAWQVIQRPRLNLRLEDFLRRVRHRFTPHAVRSAPARSSPQPRREADAP